MTHAEAWRMYGACRGGRDQATQAAREGCKHAHACEGHVARRDALASVDVVHQVAPDDLAGRHRQLEAPLAPREGGEGEAASAGVARRAEAADDVAAVVVEGGDEGVEGPIVGPVAPAAQGGV